METNFFLVQEKEKRKREEFYFYMHKNFNMEDIKYNQEEMIDSTFPFVINFRGNTLTIFKSITCCAVASKNNQIVTVEKFKEKIKERR